MFSILLETLAARGLDGCTLCWIKKWLNDQSEFFFTCTEPYFFLYQYTLQDCLCRSRFPKTYNQTNKSSKYTQVLGSWIIMQEIVNVREFH